MKVKICGLQSVRDVQICIDLKVDLLGFVFYKKSPRNLNINDIKILNNYKKLNSLFVAVAVNPSNELIKNVILGNFDYIQLHGSETAERVKEIKSMGLKIIKAIKITEERDINEYEKYDEADMILFDTPGMERSIKFQKLISKLPKGERFALAGSISVNNIENIAKLGVTFCDLSSSLELDKQIDTKTIKIKKFIDKVNELKLKGIPLIDQHDKNGMWGGKFGGNFVPETLKKPIEDLENLFSKLRKDKVSLKKETIILKNYVGTPTPLIKLDNLTDHLGGGSYGLKSFLKT